MEDLFLEGNTRDQLEIVRNCAGLAYAGETSHAGTVLIADFYQ